MTIEHIERCLAGVALLVLATVPLCAAVEAGQEVWLGPLLLSPGSRDREGRVATGCPTFSWAEVPQARGYELTVYAIGSLGERRELSEEPLLREEFPAGASSWTPELGRCLAPGRYGWVVGAIVGSGQSERPRWSRPAVFRVDGGTPKAKVAAQPVREPSGVGAAKVPATPAPATAMAPPASHTGGPRMLLGEAFMPGACTAGGEMFADVPASDPFCHWIEQLARDGVGAGCGDGNFCPDNALTRRQAAMLLERSMRGTATWSPAQGANVVAPPGNNILSAVDDPTAIVGLHASITIGADGLPLISYWDQGALALKVAHCNDVACAPGGETIITVDDPANRVGEFTSITIGADGLPIISYHDATAFALKVAHCNDVACAGHDETITTVDDPVNHVGFTSSITIGTDGLPIIAYLDQTAGDLVVAHCNDVACADQDETITAVDTAANYVGDQNSITIGADGRPIISYRDWNAGALKVAHCNDAVCAGQDETITVVDDPANDVGFTPSITIGADGLPVISYWDATAGALVVAHCNDVACAGQDETITAVDDPANSVGAFSSITIGADGLPVISYQDQTAFTLKVVHCNDLACAGQNEAITTVDSGSSAGWYTSITIGVDGLPIISHHNLNSLRVAHCANVFCTPYFRRR